MKRTRTTDTKLNASDMSPDDSNKILASVAGTARGRGRGRGRGRARGGALVLGPAPGISSPRLNRPATPDSAAENLQSISLRHTKKCLMDFIAQTTARGHFSQDFLSFLRTEASTPHFMAHHIHLFYKEAEKLLAELVDAIDNRSEIDLKKVEKILEQLKTSCLRVRAQKLHDGCVCFFNRPDGLRASLACLKMDYHTIKNFIFGLFLHLEKSYFANGGTYPL